MNCLQCGRKTRVVSTKHQGQVTRRVRRCPACRERFATHEKRAPRAPGVAPAETNVRVGAGANR